MEAKSKQKLWNWVSLSSEKNNSNFLLQHIRETLNKFLSKIVTEPKTGKWVQRGHLYETNKMSKLFQDHQLTKTTAFKLETVSLIAFVLKSTLLQKVCEVLPRVTFLAWKWWTLPGGPRKVGHNTSVGSHTHWPSRGSDLALLKTQPQKGDVLGYEFLHPTQPGSESQHCLWKGGATTGRSGKTQRVQRTPGKGQGRILTQTNVQVFFKTRLAAGRTGEWELSPEDFPKG